jgi:hypothetical protein
MIAVSPSAAARSSAAAFVSVVVLYAATLAAAGLAGRNWIAFVFLAATAFAIINPMLCACGQSWRRDTMLSAFGFFGAFVMVGVMTRAGMIPVRHDAMGLVGPVMIYLGAVPASGLVRRLLAMWRRA